MTSPRTGALRVVDVPAPTIRPNGVIVQTMASLISAGTERASLEFGQKTLLAKARSRPDLVGLVLERARRDGFMEAARVALSRLDQPAPMGYSCAGVVLAAGPEAPEFSPGDRVACAGAGYASHAEVNYVPRNLCVHLPDGRNGEILPFDEASFATLGAIALHGVRLVSPAIGDRAVVIGLGLVGLLAGQILRAHGCRVLGVDPVGARRELAASLGFEATSTPGDAPRHGDAMTRGAGADLVIVAAATADSAPLVLAGDLARDRAAVVVVGGTGLDLPRRSYFQKELSVVVSRSYGPGRYDPSFEERGQDYPIGYVRWTERENLRAVAELIADRRVLVEPLISARVPIEDAERGYAMLDAPGSLGIVLTYSPERIDLARASRVEVAASAPAPVDGAIGVSLIGAGAFGRGVLLPAVTAVAGVERRGIVTAGGATAQAAAEKFAFAFCGSDAQAVFGDARTHAVIIATRHDQHADLVVRAIESGKHVFVEKPLALREADVARIETALAIAAQQRRAPIVMVGFNRRFAPATKRVLDWRRRLAGPVTISCRVNAGKVDAGSWVADPGEGGGRLLGEVCHFVDLCAFLANAPVTQVFAHGMSAAGADDVTVTLKHADGSLSSIVYASGGDRSFSKERVELFGGGSTAVIDDFRRGTIVEHGSRSSLGGYMAAQDKGHRSEIAAFVEAVRAGSPSPVPFAEAAASTRATFAIQDALTRSMPVDLQL